VSSSRGVIRSSSAGLSSAAASAASGGASAAGVGAGASLGVKAPGLENILPKTFLSLSSCFFCFIRTRAIWFLTETLSGSCGALCGSCFSMLLPCFSRDAVTISYYYPRLRRLEI